MNCSLNWSFISCGKLHCVSVKIKTMINSTLFFLRECESLDWSDCLVVFLLSATHFRNSGHPRLIRGCFSFSKCFRAGVFSSLSRPLPAPFDSPHLLLSSGSFNMALSRANCAIMENACTAGKNEPKASVYLCTNLPGYPGKEVVFVPEHAEMKWNSHRHLR